MSLSSGWWCRVIDSGGVGRPGGGRRRRLGGDGGCIIDVGGVIQAVSWSQMMVVVWVAQAAITIIVVSWVVVVFDTGEWLSL